MPKKKESYIDGAITQKLFPPRPRMQSYDGGGTDGWMEGKGKGRRPEPTTNQLDIRCCCLGKGKLKLFFEKKKK